MVACAYILLCADGCYYYGSTTDLHERLLRHQRGRVRATAWRRPVQLVYFEVFADIEQARRRERGFKNGRTRRATIEKLIAEFPPERLQTLV